MAWPFHGRNIFAVIDPSSFVPVWAISCGLEFFPPTRFSWGSSSFLIPCKNSILIPALRHVISESLTLCKTHPEHGKTLHHLKTLTGNLKGAFLKRPSQFSITKRKTAFWYKSVSAWLASKRKHSWPLYSLSCMLSFPEKAFSLFPGFLAHKTFIFLCYLIEALKETEPALLYNFLNIFLRESLKQREPARWFLFNCAFMCGCTFVLTLEKVHMDKNSIVPQLDRFHNIWLAY